MKMKRREFITLLGGAAASWPPAARGQQAERMRCIGVLMNLAADDPESQLRIAALLQSLQELGWRGVGCTCSRRHRGRCDPERGSVATNQPHGADRFRHCHRPSQRRFGRDLGATWGQHHWFCPLGIRHECKMGGAAQRNRAARDTSGSHSGCRLGIRDRSVGSNPGGGAIVWSGIEPGRRARRD
jgi:hypothetical protein